MYLYTPDEIDRKRARHQADQQGCDDVAAKRRGNLGELAFEQFCREYLPVELWEWKNDEAMRTCQPESFSAYDFEVFGYEVDVKTSADLAAFRPKTLLEVDPDDDIVVLVWHRDKEDGLVVLGWERVDTLRSKVETQAAYTGDEPAKLDHLSARPMNELLDLGPNTAHMNQKPQNPFSPGDRVVPTGRTDADVAVVVEVLPPEAEVSVYGQPVEEEAVNVAYPEVLDEGAGDWRSTHPALLSSYCVEHDVKRYTYKHSNLETAENPFVTGDRVIKSSHGDPDGAVVLETRNGQSQDQVIVAFEGQLRDVRDDEPDLQGLTEDNGVKTYTYAPAELEWAAETPSGRS